MPARKKQPDRRQTGIEVRHAQTCGSRSGEPCDCTPGFRAFVWSARDRRRIQKTFPTEAAALRWREDARVDLRRGVLVAARPTTLREFADAWLDGARDGSIRNRSGDRYKPSTIRGIRAGAARVRPARDRRRQAPGAAPPGHPEARRRPLSRGHQCVHRAERAHAAPSDLSSRPLAWRHPGQSDDRNRDRRRPGPPDQVRDAGGGTRADRGGAARRTGRCGRRPSTPASAAASCARCAGSTSTSPAA